MKYKYTRLYRSKNGVTSMDVIKTKRMKTIKEKAEEYEDNIGSQDYCSLDICDAYESGANYVLEQIESLPNKTIDIYNLIEQLKK